MLILYAASDIKYMHIKFGFKRLSRAIGRGDFWFNFAMHILGLPKLPYCSKQLLMPLLIPVPFNIVF